MDKIMVKLEDFQSEGFSQTPKTEKFIFQPGAGFRPCEKSPSPPWEGFLAGIFARGKQCTNSQKKSMMMSISALIG